MSDRTKEVKELFFYKSPLGGVWLLKRTVFIGWTFAKQESEIEVKQVFEVTGNNTADLQIEQFDSFDEAYIEFNKRSEVLRKRAETISDIY